MKPSFNMSDLQSASKRLNSVDSSIEAKKADSKPVMDDTERNAIQSLENIYNKHNGDIDLIFQELKADPAKAKRPKHSPRNAKDFAEKYLSGRYTVIHGDDDDDNNHNDEMKNSQHK